MSMSKADFINLADALARQRPKGSDDPIVRYEVVEYALYQQWLLDRAAVAQVCGRSNPKFDVTRFYQETEKEVITT